MSQLQIGPDHVLQFFFRDSPREEMVSQIKAAGYCGVKFACRSRPLTHPTTGKYMGLEYYGHTITFLNDEDAVKFKLSFL